MASGTFSSPDQPSTKVQDYANQVESFAQKSAVAGGEFQKFVVAQVRSRAAVGTDYIAKVDTGNGDDKFVDVQFSVSEPPFYVSFVAAKLAAKSASLEPLD